MSGVNYNCYDHYYIQRQNTTIAYEQFFSTYLLQRRNNGGRTNHSSLRAGLR
ncbi:hypothetical protein M9458_034688 [Cirrhinus mrigala]|uniref:Uncharacterized protein n=1 Tax=Cirrhinus mrigala TaxID=683832 RepID=A0ABD0P824_CIRMR